MERGELERVATRTREELSDVDALRAVGYYSPDARGSIYHREDVSQTYVDSETLEDAVLESIGAQSIENFFEDDLTGTIRVFEGLVVVYCCVDELSGVLVSLDCGSEYALEDVLDAFERACATKSAAD